MSREWDEARNAWESFLRDLLACRHRLGCSYKNAWYRGHVSSDYHPMPTLLRTTQGARAADRLELATAKPALKQKVARVVTELRLARDQNDETIIRQLSKQKEKLDQDIKAIDMRVASPRPVGEREAFSEFTFRAGCDASTCSWTILAEMRHLAIPTRLLDWTESLDVALSFALESFVDDYVELWAEVENAQQLTRQRRKQELAGPCPRLRASLDHDFPYYAGAPFQRPALWVFNPYRASYAAISDALQSTADTEPLRAIRAIGRERVVLNLDRLQGLDYESCFLRTPEPIWPFRKPLPGHISWIHPYHKAQRGQFTVHGLDRRELDAHYSAKVLEQINISYAAAAYWVRMKSIANDNSRLARFPTSEVLAQDISEKFLSSMLLPCWDAKRALEFASKRLACPSANPDAAHAWLSQHGFGDVPAEMEDLRSMVLPHIDVWNRRLAIADFLYE